MGFRGRRDGPSDLDHIASRMRMVDGQLVRRGIRDARVLAAMRAVPRHLFVPDTYVSVAYDDSPQPIGHHQTISQPYIVASMTEELELDPAARVLEIGTGCGYQTAVLAEVSGEVYSIEIIPELLTRARAILGLLGYRNIVASSGDGSLGWPGMAPFDGIMVTAAAPAEPPALVEQLAVGGCLVYPLDEGRYGSQKLMKVRKTASGIDRKVLYEVRFVPLQFREGG